MGLTQSIMTFYWIKPSVIAFESSAPFSCGVPQGSVLSSLLFFFYLLQLGSTVRMYCILLYCYVDDTTIFVPLTSNEAFSSILLLKCLEDIMALNVFKFNEKKTEVMVLGSRTQTLFVELCSFVQYIKPTITNLWVKVDAEIKFDSQIRAVAKLSLFQLRHLANIKLSQQHFETVIHTFVTLCWISVIHFM